MLSFPIKSIQQAKLFNVFRTKAFENVTNLMALVGSWAGFIQVFKIFYIENAVAISIPALSIGTLNGLCWLLYGWSRQIKPLIMSNVIGLLSSLLMAIGIMIYS